MILVLYIIGAIVFVGSIVAGFLSGSVIGFFTAILGGIASAVIFFALAKIIENQENILYRLECQEEVERSAYPQVKATCPKCNYKYDSEYSSCPHCGYRE